MDTPGVKRPKVVIPRDPVLTISALVKEKLANNVAAIAIRERRTMSKMIGILLEEALKKRGVKP
jgi:hypothetical protein